MGKKWDGRFETSKYRETGNMVNDVIENNGRILHEPLGGGTHERVDRGIYIADDYYFPAERTSKKKHIHYEMRSTGDILVDGKPIERRMGMGHGRQKGKNKSFDGTIMKKESEDKVQENKELYERGKKFETDKKKLEDEMVKIENSRISATDKAESLRAIRDALIKLEEQYKKEVTEKEEKIQEELKEQIEDMQEAADELQDQIDSMRSVQLDAASTDASAAADEAQKKKEIFEQMKAEYLEKLNTQINQDAMQQRSIRSRRLSAK